MRVSTPQLGARPHLHWQHVDPWAVAVIVLAAALIALGGWVVLDRPTSSEPDGLASPGVAAMLAKRMVALNSASEEAIGRFYSADAIVEERDTVPPFTSHGREEIAARLSGIPRLWKMAGIRAKSQSAVIQFGPYAAEAASIGGSWSGILVYRLDKNGKIEHQWVIGP